MRKTTLALLAAVALAVAACAAPVEISENAPAPEELRTVLLVPLNFDTTPTSMGLVRGTRTLQAELIRYLGEDQGLGVETIELRSALRAWRRVLRDQGITDTPAEEIPPEAIDDARAELVRKLASEHRADAVVLPTLLIRQGRFVGSSLRWDGVYRKVPVQEEPGAFMTYSSIAGNGMGTSLRVQLYLPDGDRFFERYAGLEPIMLWKMSGYDGGRGSIQGVPRDDLFQDPEIILDAVQLAFEPYLERPESE